ncbi:hypothetical protein Sipo8835_11930 [Streptomyces ipomoeae]|uniref:Acyl-CoA dehydrogenase/oxidase N-terminal domain-containing protein n=1 Tax=Streptomyces ipomoeae TaxID=103232 RepID=A0AAE8W6R8_9ACTN|nr:hypothetical protein Sipo7851_24980 [Streptomyces ipomoeae]TQE35914.1 hypothetical protein Sipo8835_11930 [Streptomyces ipomoeae]
MNRRRRHTPRSIAVWRFIPCPAYPCPDCCRPRSGGAAAVDARVADGAPAPRAAEDEAAERFPRDVFPTMGRAGLLGLPFPEEWGGAGLPYEVYLQVLEEISARWASVGIGVSVHALSCFAPATHGTDDQRKRWLPDMLGGELLGAYCLSESHAGSDPAAMRTRAERDGEQTCSSRCSATAPSTNHQPRSPLDQSHRGTPRNARWA